jgi:5'-nucleotidase (lipoprotein e(P4) family)
MKRIILFIAIPIFGILLSSCEQKTPPVEKLENNDGLLMATLYVQRASEYKALCYQAYNLAHYKLDEKINNYKGDKKLAVIVDIDETVLDNSPFTAKSIIENTDYPKYWDEWCNLSKAQSIPGAMEFLKYAESRGVETFYVSNRKAHLTPATLKNLQENGFPFADSTHLFLRTKSSDKEIRRNKIREDHDVLLYFGDALGDFLPTFDEPSTEARNALANEIQNRFGNDFFVLPNPTYGTWMNSLLTGVPKSADADSVYKSRLINF